MVSSSAPSSGSGAGRNYLHAENNNNNDYTRMVLDANYHHRCVRPKGFQSDAPVEVRVALESSLKSLFSRRKGLIILRITFLGRSL